LIGQQRLFGKGTHYERIRRLQGDSLVTADGEEHRRQRQEVQHLFAPRRVQNEAPAMVEVARARLAAWHPHQTIDVVEEMKRISLRNVTRSLFHVDAEPQAVRILRAIDGFIGALHRFHRVALPFGEWLDWLPLPTNLRLRAAARTLDEILYTWIDQRATLPPPWPDDALSAVSAGIDASTPEGQARRRAARDKLLMLLVAGVETTASALASVWYLLGQTADAERALHREIDTVLGGRLPTCEDLRGLSFLTDVIREALRLQPPTSSVSRRARCPVELRSIPARIPADCSVGLSQWQIHHDARFFDRPEVFAPERWADGEHDAVPEGAYFPFGLGGRRCIGEHFALLEMKLTVAVIAQRARLVIPRGVEMPLSVSTTVRPKGALLATVEPRS
jgi:cytochrome P450